MLEKGNIVENVEITGFGDDGRSVGRADNFVLFVQDAVPGDIADVIIYKKKKNFAEGRAVKITRESMHRRQPFCEHFGTCGGCKWQHLSYERQLEFKQQQVSDALIRIGKLNFSEILPIIGSAHQKHYRNKMEYTFSAKTWVEKEKLLTGPGSNVPGLGFHVPARYDKVLDLKTCYLQEDESNTIRLEVRKYCLDRGISFYDAETRQGLMRNLIIRNTTTGEWMVIVVFHSDEAGIREPLLEHLRKQFPFITSLQYIINPKVNDFVSDLPVVLHSGRDHLIEAMEDLRFRISAKAFYQTNSRQAYELYKIVREFGSLSGSEIVYDLYTGTGTIALFMAKNARHISGIDYMEDSIADARQNASANGIENASFHAGDMKDILNEQFIGSTGRPDLIITDPPRAGMHPQVVSVIRNAGPERIVYVSCNPSTQSRDLQHLQDAYRIEKVQPVDMFPHTSHVENVVLLVKN